MTTFTSRFNSAYDSLHQTYAYGQLQAFEDMKPYLNDLESFKLKLDSLYQSKLEQSDEGYDDDYQEGYLDGLCAMVGMVQSDL